MERHSSAIVVLAISLTSMVSACLPIYRNTPEELAAHAQTHDPSVVRVRFLGVAGFHIQRGRDGVLTAPLYSNPRKTELLGELTPNTERIDHFHPDTPDVKAIFVGHAHYDHLMDVPHVWNRYRDAIIYANVSAKNILSGYRLEGSASAPQIPEGRVRAVNSPVDNVVDYRKCLDREGLSGDQIPPRAEGRWVQVPGTRVRFRALCSEHPAQILQAFHLWAGGILRPRFRPPDLSANYQEGETHAFLIDFMNEDGTEPEFRIYYQDAPTNEPIGEVPKSLIDEKRVDLTLLCVGNFVDVDEPTHIVVNTDPRYVILGHWEDFFRPQDEKLKGLPGVRTTVTQVKRAAPQAEVYLPAPQTQFQFWPETAPGIAGNQAELDPSDEGEKP